VVAIAGGGVMRKSLVIGSNGFLGTHLEYRLKERGDYVVSVGRQPPYRRPSVANEFNILDLTNPSDFHHHFFRHHFDEAYQLAGEVGGLGYIGVGTNDADILTNSLKMNLYTLETIKKTGNCDKIFFASSQCVYPDRFEIDPFVAERIENATVRSHGYREQDADFNHNFAFGQEKLYAEALYDSYHRRCGFEIRIGRLGNTYGPYCTWSGDRTKVVAAICRKVAEASYGASVEIWGDGSQTRSFTYVDDAIDGILRLMASSYSKPVNIAHSDQTSIRDLFEIICSIACKDLLRYYVSDAGPVGVASRGSDNTLCCEVLGWEPTTNLWDGLSKTYPWIKNEVEKVLTKATA
jgi:GDP-D-mannose 3', 5'-epimerase